MRGEGDGSTRYKKNTHCRKKQGLQGGKEDAMSAVTHKGFRQQSSTPTACHIVFCCFSDSSLTSATSTSCQLKVIGRSPPGSAILLAPATKLVFREAQPATSLFPPQRPIDRGTEAQPASSTPHHGCGGGGGGGKRKDHTPAARECAVYQTNK